MKKERIVVAMSGGVDSSVAAALLKQKGYEVIGVTMCFNLPDSDTKRPSCCGIQSIEDARRVCHKINIKHYVLNFGVALREKVIKDFCCEYLSGRTPNPCVRCNQYLKFGMLLKKAVSLGAKFLATGHYARIEKSRYSRDNTQCYLLKKARDLKKDQSYFLYRLGQSQLKHIIFPLGNHNKVMVRKYARSFGLPVADKMDSQEICFLPKGDYRSFLRERLKRKIKPGKILDSYGNILGEHKGIPFYTIGQRQGLGIALGYPAYITKIDLLHNTITVGKKEEACKLEFLVEDLCYVSSPIKKKIAVRVRIRYNHLEAFAQAFPLRNKVRVKFNKPQFAVTPGQSAVFYKGNQVLGGGIIQKVLD